MSAWIATDKHIASVAVTFFPPETAQEMANTMKRANIDSVNYRYSEKTRRTKCSLKDAEQLSLVDLYSLAASLDYQSCEVPDYEQTRMCSTMKLIALWCEQESARTSVPLYDTHTRFKSLLGKWSL